MFRNPYDGALIKWRFGLYTASSPDGRFEVWLGNAGFHFFADYGNSEPFVLGMGWWDRRLLYRAFIKERKQQARARIEAALPLARKNRILWTRSNTNTI
jgi:hypothetical protein